MFEDNIRSKICKNVRSSLEKIPTEGMVMGTGLFNCRCHENAVQNVIDRKCSEVYLCIVIEDKKNPIIHFINKTSDDKYQDNTLGWRYEQLEYYLIKKIDSSEFKDIVDILCDSKKEYIEKNSNWIQRKFANISI